MKNQDSLIALWKSRPVKYSHSELQEIAIIRARHLVNRHQRFLFYDLVLSALLTLAFIIIFLIYDLPVTSYWSAGLFLILLVHLMLYNREKRSINSFITFKGSLTTSISSTITKMKIVRTISMIWSGLLAAILFGVYQVNFGKGVNIQTILFGAGLTLLVIFSTYLIQRSSTTQLIRQLQQILRQLLE